MNNSSVKRDTKPHVTSEATEVACNHEWDRDYFLGSHTGDYICRKCGKVSPSKD